MGTPAPQHCLRYQQSALGITTLHDAAAHAEQREQTREMVVMDRGLGSLDDRSRIVGEEGSFTPPQTEYFIT